MIILKKEKDLIPKEFHIGLSKFFTHEYLKNEMDKLSIQANHQILKLNEDDRKKKCEEFMKESDKILETLQQEYEILCNPKIFINGSDQSLPQSGGGGGGDGASDEHGEEDRDLKRGVLLKLEQNRLEELRKMIAKSSFEHESRVLSQTYLNRFRRNPQF